MPSDVIGELTADLLFQGVCFVKMRAGDGVECSGLKESLACAKRHCQGPEACAGVCSSFKECLAQAEEAGGDQCIRALDCATQDTRECQSCWERYISCAWYEHCSGLYKCGSTEEGGSCAKLEACCNTQVDPSACLGWMDQQRILGGDMGCQSLLDDPAFLKAYANDPPCEL